MWTNLWTKNEFYVRIKSVISKRLVRLEIRDPTSKSLRFFTIEKRISPKGVTINDISNIVTISFERKKLSVYNESNNSFLSTVSFSIMVLVIKTNTKREKMWTNGMVTIDFFIL